MPGTLIESERENSAAVLEEVVGGVSAIENWKPSSIIADIAKLGTGSLAAAGFNVALIFIVPKLISVEQYGYWRMFSLYAAYVGFLHFGFVDGALLRWAGSPFEAFRMEIAPAMKFLLRLTVPVIVVIGVLSFVFFKGDALWMGLMVAVYTLLLNEVTLLQYSLESAKAFRPVAVSMVAAPGIFLIGILLAAATGSLDARNVVNLYLAGWFVAFLFLFWYVKPWRFDFRSVRVAELAKQCLGAGWAILAANGTLMLIGGVDRLVLSWTTALQSFAQYSMAASAMAVPLTVIQACSKVFFSHLAGATPDGRRRIYGTSSRVLLLLWCLALPYYFALEWFVRHFLPKYVPSLQFSRILLLSIPFLAVVQILQMSYAYLNGRQVRFLRNSLAFLAAGIVATLMASVYFRSLTAIATIEVLLLGAWWLFNEWSQRELTSHTGKNLLAFLGLFSLAGAAFWAISGASMKSAILIPAYYGCLAIILAVFCRNDIRLWKKMLSGKSKYDQALGPTGNEAT